MKQSIDKEFQKTKRYVQKRFPGARTVAKPSGSEMYFQVVDGNGYAITNAELLIPPATNVKQAWTNAKYSAWFSNMIHKSNVAFSDEKIIKKLAREAGEE